MNSKSNMNQLPIRYWYLIILSLSGFVTSFGAHIVATNLPPYVKIVGGGAFLIGLLIAIYDFAELFAKPLAGYIADKRGMKIVLLIGILIFIFGSLLFLLLDPKFLLLVRFIQGIGAAALSTVSITLVAKYFTTDRGRAFGIYNAIKGAGYVISPALGGFIISEYGFTMVFTISAAIGAFVFFLALFLPEDHNQKVILEDDNDVPLKQFFSIFKESRLLFIYGIIVVNMFLVSILFGFLPVYLYSIGYTPFQSGMTVSLATVSYLLVQPFAGYLADKIQIHYTIFLGLIIASITIGALTFTSGIALKIILIFAGIGVGTVWTNSDTLVSSLADPEKLGASMGAAQTFKEFGDMFGPLLIGTLIHFFGVQVGFLTCSLLTIPFLIFLKRSRRS